VIADATPDDWILASPSSILRELSSWLANGTVLVVVVFVITTNDVVGYTIERIATTTRRG